MFKQPPWIRYLKDSRSLVDQKGPHGVSLSQTEAGQAGTHSNLTLRALVALENFVVKWSVFLSFLLY